MSVDLRCFVVGESQKRHHSTGDVALGSWDPTSVEVGCVVCGAGAEADPNCTDMAHLYE